jgi:hypothetical protein
MGIAFFAYRPNGKRIHHKAILVERSPPFTREKMPFAGNMGHLIF